MRAVFQGHNRPASIVPVTGEELRRRCASADPCGAFLHNGSIWLENDVLTVAFRPEILLVDGIPAQERTDTINHERRHERDFRELAERLRQGVQGAIREGLDPEIDARWTWFIYDNAVAATNYHRELLLMDCVAPPFPPRVPRPE